VNAAREQHLAYAVVSASQSAMNEFLEKDSVGAIVWLSQEKADQISKYKVPFINVGNSFGPLEGLGNILSDDVAVGRLAAAYLKQKGYKQFRCFYPKEGGMVHQERSQGFEKSFLETPGIVKSFGLDITSTQQKNWTVLRFVEEMSERFAPHLDGLEPDTGIFCTNDWLGGILLNVLRLDYPDLCHTVGVLGVDNLNENIWYGMDMPGLSSIVPGFTNIGREAVCWLAAHPGELGKSLAPTVCRRFPPENVVTRASTVAGGCRDPLTAQMSRLIWGRVQNGQEVSVEALAREFKMSRKTIYRNFVNHLGHGPGEEIDRQKLALAKDLLHHTSLSISEISKRCRFAKQDVLSRLMRREEDCTPREFRKRATA
jgi:LacI family transcriptional regulator